MTKVVLGIRVDFLLLLGKENGGAAGINGVIESR